jgi:hypothetical protein
MNSRRQVGLGSYQLKGLALEVLDLPGSFRKFSMKVLQPIPKSLSKTTIFD